jgi:hypothetical protein
VFSAFNTVQPSATRNEVDSVPFSLSNSAALVTHLKRAPGSTSGSPVGGVAPPRHATPTAPGRIGQLSTPLASLLIDSDGDGLADEEEIRLGTNPFDPDTDHDGYPDGLEVSLGSDPLDPNSIPDIRPPGYFAGPVIDVMNSAIFVMQAGNSPLPAKGENHVTQQSSSRNSSFFEMVGHFVRSLRSARSLFEWHPASSGPDVQ